MWNPKANQNTETVSVLVSGCYDIVHSGHIRFIQDAKVLGNHLVVVVPTDDAIRKAKGREPAMTLEDRVYILKNIKGVDQVVVGTDDLPLNYESLITSGLISPAIIAATTDDRFAKEKKRFAEEHGIQYIQLPKTPVSGLSTTKIRERIQKGGK